MSYFNSLLVLLLLIALAWVVWNAYFSKRGDTQWQELLFLLANLFAAHFFVERRFFFLDIGFEDKYVELMEFRYSTPFQSRFLVPLLMRGFYLLAEGSISILELAKIFDCFSSAKVGHIRAES